MEPIIGLSQTDLKVKMATNQGGGQMKHDIFGEIKFDEFWVKNYKLELYSRLDEGSLVIDGESDDKIELLQIEAYRLFDENLLNILIESRKMLFDYYQENCDEYRTNYGDVADDYAPIIKDEMEMDKLLNFESVYVPYQFNEDELEIGILFQSKWEIEHGIAVRIINGQVHEVGYQDIVL